MRYLTLLAIFVSLLFAANCKQKKEIPKNAIPLEKVFDPNKDFCMFIVPQLKDLKRVDGKGTIGLKAKDCSECHTTIYNEWKEATHAAALDDLQFQAEIAKDSSPKWQCLNCHIQIQNQREYKVTHLGDGSLFQPVKEDNPDFDPEFKKDAVTCATCHVRKDEKGESYVIGALGTGNAPHPVKKDKRFLRKRCFFCHNVPKAPTDETFLCYFTTGVEWRQGPYGLIDPEKDRYKGKKDCVDCHMPTVERHIADNYNHLPKKKVHQHHWVGGGVPKTFKSYDKLLERGFETSLAVHTDKPGDITAGADIDFAFILENTDINGHRLPTGDLERFLFAEASLIDANGKRIAHEYVRLGQEWDWSLTPMKMGDTRLRPFEKRNWDFTMKMPESLEGAKLVVEVNHVRLLPKTVDYIKQTPKIEKQYQKKIDSFENHYPMSSIIFKEEINLKDFTKKRYTMKELIAISKGRQGKKQLERLKEIQELIE